MEDQLPPVLKYHLKKYGMLQNTKLPSLEEDDFVTPDHDFSDDPLCTTFDVDGEPDF